jgi:hypothetical protein
MTLLIILIVLILLFGGGGFVVGDGQFRNHGLSLGTVLLIVLIVLLFSGRLT